MPPRAVIDIALRLDRQPRPPAPWGALRECAGDEEATLRMAGIIGEKPLRPMMAMRGWRKRRHRAIVGQWGIKLLGI